MEVEAIATKRGDAQKKLVKHDLRLTRYLFLEELESMIPKLKFRYQIALGIVVLLGVILLRVGRVPPLSFVANATAPGIPPELKQLTPNSYLLTWTDDSVVYVACYPTVSPKMTPAPIPQTPLRQVITCQE